VTLIARGSGTSVREVEEYVPASPPPFSSTADGSFARLTSFADLSCSSLLMQHHMMGNMAKSIGGAQPKANPSVVRSTPSSSVRLAPNPPRRRRFASPLVQERGAGGQAASGDGRPADGPRRPAEPAADDGDPGAPPTFTLNRPSLIQSC
jgi:hypothetical protein